MLELELGKGHIRVKRDDVTFTSKLIDGRFPDYQRVIPASLRNVVSVSRTALLQSMVRAAILTNEKFRGVRLMLADGSLKIMAANAEQEEAVDERTENEVTRPVLRIGEFEAAPVLTGVVRYAVGTGVTTERSAQAGREPDAARP